MKVITLSRPAVCKSCGAGIPSGAKARYYSGDAIYCESHKKDASGHDIPNTSAIPQPSVQQPLERAASEPQPLFSAPDSYDTLVDKISLLTDALQWQTEKVALATDFLNTLCILMRQNQEARNAQTINSQKRGTNKNVSK
jgi:hypothetical protein